MTKSPSSSAGATPRCPVWRSEPYLLFFPTGVVLGWTGIFHWLLHSLRFVPEYRPVFHAMTQIQGFMTCVALGFLFTMIPRRTESAPPATWEIIVCLVAPFVTVVAAWNRLWNLSQAAWLLVAVTAAVFTLRRFHGQGSGRRPPNAFVWIPLALAMGIAGASISLIYGQLDPAYAWLHTFARGLILQGMLIGLILGAGGLALPLMTRDEAPADAGSAPRDRLAQVAHIGAAALLVASFWIEATISLPGAMWLRASVVLSVYLFGTDLWKPPLRPGWNARAIWFAAWMIPLGYIVAALFPGQVKGGLHITFVGGFALLGLLISTQVTLGHGGYSELRLGKPWAVPFITALMLAAMAFRVAMEFDPRRFFVWMAVAAFLFLCAALAWGIFVIPKLVARALAEG